MSENDTTGRNVSNDEIDLLELFRRMGRSIGRGFKSIGKAILISLVFIARRWLPLGITIFLGFVIATVLSITFESYYTSDLILKSNIEETDEVIAYVNRLQTLISEENIENLSKAVSLNEAQTKNILDIRANWIIDEGNDDIPDYIDYEDNHDVYDTINVRMKDRLNIRVRIKKPQELQNLREGIINYINSDPLFQQRNEIRLRQNSDMLARVEASIVELDSLQMFKMKNYTPKTANQMIILQEQPIQLIYKDIHQLYKIKQDIEQENTLYKDIVTVLSEFSIPYEKDNSLFFYLKKTVPALFLIVLLILVIVSNSRNLKEVYNRY